MPKAKVGDIEMYYEIHGQGDPLLMIPGGGGNHHQVLRRILDYTREFQVIVYDPRGKGQTTDNLDVAYTHAMGADDAAGLLDVIGISRAHIRGGSMGGMVAQELALRQVRTGTTTA